MDKAPRRTLYDKIFEDHVVANQQDSTCLLYIDRHLVEDHASSQAFDNLRMKGQKLRAPKKTLAVVDHNIPTTDRSKGIGNEESRISSPAMPGSSASNTSTSGMHGRASCM